MEAVSLFDSTTRAAAQNGARKLLTVAVTGAGGRIGPALLERLAAAHEVTRVIALGRHRTDAMRRYDKVEFRDVDVRDEATVADAIDGSDVVIHMAFSLYGVLTTEQALFDTNVRGTLNLARAAAAAGVGRFLYTSSAAVYGDGGTEAHPLGEDAPVCASTRLFYARHKAQAELIVQEALAGSATDLYMFRPCAIVGPHVAGALATQLTAPLGFLAKTASRLGLRPVLTPPPVPLQFVHEDDVAAALMLAAVGPERPGTYNLAGDGWLSGAEAVKEAGLRPLPVPRATVGASLGAIAQVPPLMPAIGWFELIRRPLLIDTARARSELGWKPRFTSLQALRSARAAVGW